MSANRCRIVVSTIAVLLLLLLGEVFSSRQLYAALPTPSSSPGANAQATVSALQTQIADAQGTISSLESAATIESLQTQVAESRSDLASAEATISYLRTQMASDQITIPTTDNATVTALEQQVAARSLNPKSVTEKIQVDLNGVIGNNSAALADAKKQLEGVFAKYVSSANCTVGFALISSRSQDLGQGVQLSKSIADLIQSDIPQILPKDASGNPGQLISESIALPGTTPTGQVELQLFFNTGCQPAS